MVKYLGMTLYNLRYRESPDYEPPLQVLALYDGNSC
ncbi:Uncharacterised protein [Vibrio cholerae]|nr:Uncharacterised protein [Vibrio cholerae]CSI49652.1 Uncharacterised protein [Vibrio cholerae]